MKAAGGDDDSRFLSDELGRERRQPVELIERPAKFDPIVAQLD